MTASITIPAARATRPVSGTHPTGGRSRRSSSSAEPRALTMREVRERGYFVFRDGVYDAASFRNRHPGGSFLDAFAGTDATIAIENAHGIGSVPKALRGLYVAPFAEATRDPVDADLLTLREDLRTEGFFDYGTERLLFDVVRWVVLFGAAVFARDWSRIATLALVLAGTVDVVWWIHDAGHNAIFARERTARRVIEWLGVIVLGMPQCGYHYGIHRIHHGFPNVVGVDRALETGTLSWDLETASQKPALFRHGRLAQWFLVVVPLAGPGLLATAVSAALSKRQRMLLAAVALRWVVVVVACFQTGVWELALAPWLAGSILAFMAGLNHFHLPMTNAPAGSYVRSVFERTQNIGTAGWFWHWVSGGLDLHIEHHLFPTMPSHRYRRVAARVQAFATRHGLPYRTTTRLGAIRNLVDTLRRPLPAPSTASSGRASAGCPFRALARKVAR